MFHRIRFSFRSDLSVGVHNIFPSVLMSLLILEICSVVFDIIIPLSFINLIDQFDTLVDILI